MSRCIIHVGMHKTGSTSIQNSLQGFSDERFLYADLGKVPNHSLAIYSLFAVRPERHHLHRANRRDADAVRAYASAIRSDLERAISAAKGRTLLISGEDISILPQASLAGLREYFCQRFDELDIVGYVRAPAGYMASAFQQRVRGGSMRHLDLEREYRSYEKRFAKFDEVFGREHVQLWKFDLKTLRGGCAVQDFCSRLGIALAGERIVRLNESLSRQAVALLYTYHKLGSDHGARTIRGLEGQKLGAMLRTAGNDRFRFSPDILRPILEKNRADIDWIEARLGQSLHEDLGEHQPGDVRDESDLLNPEPETVHRLLALMGDRAPAGAACETPEQVAALVHALRGKLGHSPSKATDLIEEILAENPELLEGIPVNQAAVLVGKVFKHMNDVLASTHEGVATFGSLGEFHVRKTEKQVGERNIARTQIVFRLAEPKAGRRVIGGAEAGSRARGDNRRRKRSGEA